MTSGYTIVHRQSSGGAQHATHPAFLALYWTRQTDRERERAKKIKVRMRAAFALQRPRSTVTYTASNSIARQDATPVI